MFTATEPTDPTILLFGAVPGLNRRRGSFLPISVNRVAVQIFITWILAPR